MSQTDFGKNFHEKLGSQIKNAMRKAFFDLLKDRLNDDPPDCDWLITLFTELRDRLCNLTPNRNDLKSQIYEILDIELFSQMIRHNAYKPEDLYKLVHFTFGKIKIMGSIAKEPEIDAIINKLNSMMMSNDFKFSEFIPVFIGEFHNSIQDIEDGIALFKEQIKNGTFGQQEKQSTNSFIMKTGK